MRETKNVGPYRFRMSAHIAADVELSLLHPINFTSANVPDDTPIAEFLQIAENAVYLEVG